MPRHRETDDEYYARTGKLREGDWGGPEETSPGFGETLSAEAQRALEEKIANGLIGEKKKKGETQAEFEARRDADDAGAADSAFTAILAAAVGTLLTPGVAATLASAGIGSGLTVPYAAVVSSAATATRIAWAKLSQQDRAKIWRGEV